MGLFSRRREVAELRSQVAGLQSRALSTPWADPSANPYVSFGEGGPAHPSEATTGVDSALRLGPVYAAARLLADSVASLPLQVYRPDSAGAPQKYSGPTIFNSTPEVGPMGHGPSVVGTMFDWVFQCVSALVLEGNAFGFIATRDGLGYPTTIEWLAPHLVHIDEGVTGGIPNPLRAEYYFEGRHVPREDMFHVRAFTVAGRTRGISPMRNFANLIAQGKAMGAYSQGWFGSGGFPLGIMKNSTQEINSEQSAEIKSNLMAALRRRQPLVMGSDWEYQAVSVPPNEAAFIEAVGMNATQIAAIYGIPAYRIGGNRGSSITYSNVESETISFLTDTLRPWLVRLEDAFYGLLPGNRYARFNADAMIRTDTKTRHEVHQIDRTIGLLTLDEIRQIEDLPPLLPDGAGKDPMPLLVASDLARSGKAIPSSLTDSVTVLGMPDSPAAPASDDTPDGTVVQMPARKGPAQVPAARSTPIYSLTEVATAWAGHLAADPLVLRSYLAETAIQARRHGVKPGGYATPCLDTGQRDWLVGFLKASGEPPARKIG